MDKEMLNQITFGLRAFFTDDEIPEGFLYEGQTLEQRCEGWALHALGQLEDEIECVKTHGPYDPNEDKGEQVVEDCGETLPADRKRSGDREDSDTDMPVHSEDGIGQSWNSEWAEQDSCPYCGSADVQHEPFDHEMEAYPTECEDCGKRWLDGYVREGFIPYTDQPDVSGGAR